MNKINAMKKTFFSLLVTGVIMLFLLFLLISCGKGPKLKVLNFNAGQYALDFTDCPGTLCKVSVALTGDQNPLENKPLTVEAWVKVKPTSSSAESGAIVGRISSATGGMALYIKDDVPKFIIANRNPSLSTSSPYTVSSGVSLSNNTWHHIAGVLANTVHSHPSSSTCALNVGNQTPHLDIYVDGDFKGCATTNSSFSTSSSNAVMSVGIWGESGDAIEDITPTTPFHGIIDEVRIWGVEKTANDIQSCMNQELSLTGACNRSGLLGYFRFNEGKGSVTAEWSGLGSGAKEYLNVTTFDWTTGWTTDTPF